MRILTTEVLKDKKIKIPVITGIRDLVSKSYDGTITSQGPIVVNGEHLDMLHLNPVRLCLVCRSNVNQIIDVCNVYKHSSEQLIVSLPVLMPGEYSPAIKIFEKEEETSVYIIPARWIVL